MSELSKEEMILAKFRHAVREHDTPLTLQELRAQFGKPKSRKSDLNVEEISKDFKRVYHMCNGMHRNYEW